MTLRKKNKINFVTLLLKRCAGMIAIYSSRLHLYTLVPPLRHEKVSHRVLPSSLYLISTVRFSAMRFGFLATIVRVVIVEPEISYVPEFAQKES